MSIIVQESPAKKAATHPKVSIMVEAAIKTLAERKGSSLSAIKKYIDANYDANAEKLSTFIKKYLKAAVASGDLIQTSGKGASGSFKINKQKVEAKPKSPKEKLKKPSRMLISTPKKVLKRKKPAAKSPNQSPVKKIEEADAQAEPAVNATFTKPKATRVKKAKVSLPTKPRKSLVSVPKVKRAKQLLAKQSPPRQKTSISPAKTKKKVATKSAMAKKSPKPAKTEPSILKKAPVKKTASKDKK